MRTIHSILTILCIIIIAFACHPKLSNGGHFSSTGSHPPTLNKVITDEDGHPELAGISNEEGLQQPPFGDWYLRNYNDYTPDSLTLLLLRPELRGKTFQIFMGTWCGDSKREVPRLFRILFQCGIPPTAVTLINVGRTDSTYKQSPTHEERGKDIHHVPTIIMYENGKEINRIVEAPVRSLENDLLQIARKEAYVPKYLGAAWMLQWYSHADWADHVKDSTILATDLKKVVLHRGELGALGSVQLSANEIDKAVFTYQLNTMLYPEEPATYSSLAKALLRKGDTAAAKSYLEKAARYPKQ